MAGMRRRIPNLAPAASLFRRRRKLVLVFLAFIAIAAYLLRPMGGSRSNFDPRRLKKVTIFDCDGMRAENNFSGRPIGVASAELTPEDISQTLAFGQFSGGPHLTNGGYSSVAETVDGQ